jgi:hypothetical protein
MVGWHLQGGLQHNLRGRKQVVSSGPLGERGGQVAKYKHTRLLQCQYRLTRCHIWKVSGGVWGPPAAGHGLEAAPSQATHLLLQRAPQHVHLV